MKNSRIVIALGGNAILKKGEKNENETQERNTDETIEKIGEIIKNNETVITHGNGPQVGNLLLDNHNLPLYILDAMTQGQIGFFILKSLQKKGIDAANIVTRIIVDEKEDAFKNPTKPIGPFFKEPVMEGMKEDSGRGYRLVVPSPKPIKVVEKESIEELIKMGKTVVAVGGGGVPIDEKGNGINCVIDKDKASALLANEINAEYLIILTSVDGIYLNYGKGPLLVGLELRFRGQNPSSLSLLQR